MRSQHIYVTTLRVLAVCLILAGLLSALPWCEDSRMRRPWSKAGAVR